MRDALFGLMLLACGGVAQPVVCRSWVACSESVTPGSTVLLQSSYGPDGTCWKYNQAAIDECTRSCVEALAILRADAGANVAGCR